MRKKIANALYHKIYFRIESPYSTVDKLYVEITKWKNTNNNRRVYNFRHDSLIYIYEGALRIEVGNDKVYHAEADDILLLRGGTEWRYFMQTRKSVTTMSLNFTGSLTDQMLLTYGLSDGIHVKKTNFYPHALGFESICMRTDISEEELADELIAFLLKIFRHCAYLQKPPRSVAADIQKFIAAKFLSASLSIPMLSQQFRLRPSEMQAIFKKEYGMTIHAYIVKLRLDEVRRLLAETNRTVSDIANAVGYGNHCHLDRLFRKTFGMSPLEYRRSVQSPDTAK